MRWGDSDPMKTRSRADVAHVAGVVVECRFGTGLRVRRHGAEA